MDLIACMPMFQSIQVNEFTFPLLPDARGEVPHGFRGQSRSSYRIGVCISNGTVVNTAVRSLGVVDFMQMRLVNTACLFKHRET